MHLERERRQETKTRSLLILLVGVLSYRLLRLTIGKPFSSPELQSVPNIEIE